MPQKPMRFLAALFWVVLAGCSKCGRAPSGGGEWGRVLPKEAELLFVVPDLAVVGKKVQQVEALKVASFAAQLQGFGSAKELVDSVMAQAGIDLRSAEAMEKAGLAPTRGFAFVQLANGHSFSVVGVRDEKAFRARVEELAKTRLGATQSAEETVAGTKVTVLSRKNAPSPLLALAFKGDLAFLAVQSPATTLSRLLSLQESEALISDDVHRTSLGRLPKGYDAYVYVPPGSSLGKQARLNGIVTTFELTERAFTVRSDAPWSYASDALKVLEKVPGPALWRFLPADAFLVARYGSEPARLGALLPYVLPDDLKNVFKEAGMDPRKDFLALIKPGALAAVSLAPNVNLAAGMPSLDVRRTNPFRYVHLTAVGEVTEPDKVKSALAKFPALAPRVAAKVEPSERNGKTVYVTSYRQGEGVHFAVDQDKAVAAAPMSRMDEALQRVAAPPEPNAGALSGSDLRAVAEGQGIVVVVDLQKLTAQVKALPSEAWGLGGFAIKAATERWLDAAGDLQAIVVSVSAAERAVQGELALRFTGK